MTVRYNVGDRVRVLTLTRDDMMLIDFLKVNHVDEYGIMVESHDRSINPIAGCNTSMLTTRA